MVSAHSRNALAASGPPSAETATFEGVPDAAGDMAAAASEIAAADNPLDGSKKYHVLMELGRGGAGIVSAAIARGIGGFSKLVVLKTTKPELDSPDAVKLLLNEARLSARMNHPNIVQVYEVYQEAGVPVIVMEYLDGQSLAKLLSRALRDPAYSVEIGLTIVCKVLEALEYAHTLTDFGGRPLGIVHRDVTPQNVMITYDGQIKLLDFGIAKLNLQSAGADTGSVKGKLSYMSPEQLAGLRLDASADVFAVGVMLWEVVARRRMWANHGDADIMRRLLTDDVPSLREAVPDLDTELERICNQALSPRTHGRYESAKALLLDLQRYLAERGGAVSASTIVELMDRSCADLRASVQLRLEQELAKFSRSMDEDWSRTSVDEIVGSLASKEHPRASDAARDTTPATPLGRKGDTGSARGVEILEATQTQVLGSPRFGAWWLVAAALLSVSGWSVAGRQRWLQREPELDVSSAATEVVAPAAPEGASAEAKNGAPAQPAPEMEVSVTVSAEPARARIFIDDQLVENPYRASRSRDAKVHELRVEAEGHLPIVRSLRFDADVELGLALQAAPAPSKTPATRHQARGPLRAKPEKAGRATTPEPKAAAVRSKAANCDPPYYFDEHGIKHFLRECLKN